ncbi:hypothetical protein KP719_03765, partial [Staphylococcus aureus]
RTTIQRKGVEKNKNIKVHIYKNKKNKQKRKIINLKKDEKKKKKQKRWDNKKGVFYFKKKNL